RARGCPSGFPGSAAGRPSGCPARSEARPGQRAPIPRGVRMTVAKRLSYADIEAENGVAFPLVEAHGEVEPQRPERGVIAHDVPPADPQVVDGGEGVIGHEPAIHEPDRAKAVIDLAPRFQRAFEEVP